MSILFFQSDVMKAMVVKDLRQSVHKILQKIMTDEVATEYSLCGKLRRTAKETVSTSKHNFEKTNLFKLIYGK